MAGFGGILFFVGLMALVGSFFVESALPGASVANLSMMNLKLMLAIAGGPMLVAGAVFIGADELRQAIRETSKGADRPEPPLNAR